MKIKTSELTGADLAAPAHHPGDMRKYVEAFAAKSGWNPESGEGAFEYVQRICYSQGFEDATVQSQRKTHAATTGMQPVYQIGQPFPFDPENTWRDASKDAYDVCMPSKRRIIYTESQVQAVPVRTPLTDRQIGAVIDEVATTSRYGNHHFGRWMDFARAIEQAHGIKVTNPESNK